MNKKELVRFEEVTPTLLPVAYFDGHLADLISHLQLPIYGGYNDLDEMSFAFLTLPSGKTLVVGEYSNAPRIGVDLYVDSKQVDIPAAVYESCQQLGKSRNQVVWFREKFQAEIDQLFVEQGDVQEIEKSTELGIHEVVYNPIACFQHALRIYDRAGFPEYWAMLQYNLGTAYYQAFKSGDGDLIRTLRVSIHCYHKSETVYTQDKYPERWKISQETLGIVKTLLKSEELSRASLSGANLAGTDRGMESIRLNSIGPMVKKNAEGSPKKVGGSIRIIGDRGSGKTAYMAALARWPNASKDSPVKSVMPINEAGEDLINSAKNLLEQGLELESTDVGADPEEIKDYAIGVILQNTSSWRNLVLKNVRSRTVELNIRCKDYSGEFFSDLLSSRNDPMLEAYLEDCYNAQGLALLIDGTSHRKDQVYADGLDRLLAGLDRFNLGNQPRRIACVITKAEQSELIMNRNKPSNYLHSRRFPNLYGKLKDWQRSGQGAVDFFVASAFGTIDPRGMEGNYKLLSRRQWGGTQSIIKDPSHWQPFGLISPLYWLCTGERHKDLDQY
jgi:hypothetical protein